MDESGLITRYLNFMDSDQERYVRELVRQSRDYRHFVSTLVDRVTSDPNTGNLLPFALRCCYVLGDMSYISRLRSTFGYRIVTLPWYTHALYYVGQIPSGDVAAERMRESIGMLQEDWILFEARILLTLILGDMKSHEVFDILSALEDEAKADRRYESFIPWIENSRGAAFFARQDLERSKAHFKKAIAFANRWGDKWVLAISLNMLALMTKGVNESLDYLYEARDILKEMGNLLFEGTMENNIGFHKVALARYDEAIEHYNRAIEINREAENIAHHPFLNISVLYSNLGQSEKALEYAQKALEVAERKNPEHPAPQTEMARALILSERIDEAYDYLETGGELAFKSGSNVEICRYYLVRGMMELSKDDHMSAISTLKRGLRIADNDANVYYILQLLLQLAGAEILILAEQDDDRTVAEASTALARLEQISHEQDFSGLSAQVKILKAEIDAIRGNKDIARSRLEEALKICDTEGMLSLRSKIQSRLEGLDEKKTRKSLVERFKRMLHQIAIPSGQTKNTPFVVMGCIVIMQQSGLEVFSKYLDSKIISDPSLVAGLISAVSNFTGELREDATGNLQSIVHQDIAVLLEHGSHATCALLVDRDTYEARLLERRFLERFEELFFDDLKRFEDGAVEPINATSIFQTIVQHRKLAA